jgi:hypothetical protein
VSKQWHTSTACHITASTVHSNTNDNSHRTPTLAPNASRWGPIFYSTATDPTLATNASGWGRMLAGMGPNDVTRHLGSGMFFIYLIYSSANIYIGIFTTTTPTTPTTDPPSLQTRVGGSVPFEGMSSYIHLSKSLTHVHFSATRILPCCWPIVADCHMETRTVADCHMETGTIYHGHPFLVFEGGKRNNCLNSSGICALLS